MLIGTGCGVPAVMAARTIENEKDRRMTIMLSTFMPCTAKYVIIAMITSVFFPRSVLIAPAMYFLGVAVIVLSGIGLKKTKYFGGDPAPFVMELPPYHIPSLKGVLIHMWERSRAFIIKAGTIIFTACVVIWFLSKFSWNMQFLDSNIENSMLAGIGNAIAWIFAPLGFGNWKGAVAVISAEMAKEQAIGTLAVLNGVADTAIRQADPDVLLHSGPLARMPNKEEIILAAAVIICIALAAVMFYAVKRMRKTLKNGCCGIGGSDICKEIKIKDKNRAHYPYRRILDIDGMHCKNCAIRVQNALNMLPGVYAGVNFRKKSAEIYMKNDMENAVLRKTVADAGYSVAGIRMEA